MSAGGLIDWRIAERSARVAIGGIGPVGGADTPDAGQRYTEAEVAAACGEAIESAAAYAGLGAVEAPPAPELIDRDEWARTALSTLAEAVAPIERRIADDVRLPGPFAGIARRLAGPAGGIEAGLAVGYAARRVLGQYDVAVFGAQRPARLLFVGENLAAARLRLGVDAGLFLHWVALHETTHVIQFERVEWLAGHVRELAAELIEGTARGLDTAGLGRLGRQLLRDPRELVRTALRGELVRALADPAQRRTLDRLQATMSVIEGHAEHVMDAAAPELGPGIADLRRRMDERRARRGGGLGEVIGRLLGIDLKLRQYELGKAFCDALARERGPAGPRLLWAAPEHLPDLGELEYPGRWLDRVTGFSPASA